MISLVFPLIEHEGELWVVVDHDWQPHRPGQDFLAPDEYLYTLTLVREMNGEKKVAYLKDMPKEEVERLLFSEDACYRRFVLEEES